MKAPLALVLIVATSSCSLYYDRCFDEVTIEPGDIAAEHLRCVKGTLRVEGTGDVELRHLTRVGTLNIAGQLGTVSLPSLVDASVIVNAPGTLRGTGARTLRLPVLTTVQALMARDSALEDLDAPMLQSAQRILLEANAALKRVSLPSLDGIEGEGLATFVVTDNPSLAVFDAHPCRVDGSLSFAGNALGIEAAPEFATMGLSSICGQQKPPSFCPAPRLPTMQPFPQHPGDTFGLREQVQAMFPDRRIDACSAVEFVRADLTTADTVAWCHTGARALLLRRDATGVTNICEAMADDVARFSNMPPVVALGGSDGDALVQAADIPAPGPALASCTTLRAPPGVRLKSLVNAVERDGGTVFFAPTALEAPDTSNTVLFADGRLQVWPPAQQAERAVRSLKTSSRAACPR